MGASKRSRKVDEEGAVEDEADAIAAKKAAKKAKKAAAAASVEPEAEAAEAEDDAVAAKKATKKNKKAAATAAEPGTEKEDDAEASALAAKKAAKKARKAAAAAAAAEVAEPGAEEEEDAEAAALAAKKAAKKAKKAVAVTAAAAEEDTDMAHKDEAATKPKTNKDGNEDVTKAKPAKDAAADEEEWKDNTYQCVDCSGDWVDTADDQEFRYNKGFAETPKRCKDCRWAKKVRMEGGDPTAKGKGKKGGKSGGDENTVFVRGLPYSANEDMLNKDFAECGEIVSLRLPLNDEGQSRGIAFIKFSDKEAMDKALAFNETDYGGRTIYCSDAAIKPEGKGKGKDGKGKGKDGKDGKGKGKKGKKGKAPSEARAKSSGAMLESTGKKVAFEDSDEE